MLYQSSANFSADPFTSRIFLDFGQSEMEYPGLEPRTFRAAVACSSDFAISAWESEHILSTEYYVSYLNSVLLNVAEHSFASALQL